MQLEQYSRRVNRRPNMNRISEGFKPSHVSTLGFEDNVFNKIARGTSLVNNLVSNIGIINQDVERTQAIKQAEQDKADNEAMLLARENEIALRNIDLGNAERDMNDFVRNLATDQNYRGHPEKFQQFANEMYDKMIPNVPESQKVAFEENFNRIVNQKYNGIANASAERAQQQGFDAWKTRFNDAYDSGDPGHLETMVQEGVDSGYLKMEDAVASLNTWKKAQAMDNVFETSLGVVTANPTRIGAQDGEEVMKASGLYQSLSREEQGAMLADYRREAELLVKQDERQKFEVSRESFNSGVSRLNNMYNLTDSEMPSLTYEWIREQKKAGIMQDEHANALEGMLRNYIREITPEEKANQDSTVISLLTKYNQGLITEEELQAEVSQMAANGELSIFGYNATQSVLEEPKETFIDELSEVLTVAGVAPAQKQKVLDEATAMWKEAYMTPDGRWKPEDQRPTPEQFRESMINRARAYMETEAYTTALETVSHAFDVEGEAFEFKEFGRSKNLIENREGRYQDKERSVVRTNMAFFQGITDFHAEELNQYEASVESLWDETKSTPRKSTRRLRDGLPVIMDSEGNEWYLDARTKNNLRPDVDAPGSESVTLQFRPIQELDQFYRKERGQRAKRMFDGQMIYNPVYKDWYIQLPGFDTLSSLRDVVETRPTDIKFNPQLSDSPLYFYDKDDRTKFVELIQLRVTGSGKLEPLSDEEQQRVIDERNAEE
jgi:hypothetical protein